MTQIGTSDGHISKCRFHVHQAVSQDLTARSLQTACNRDTYNAANQRGYNSCLLEHVKILGSVPTDAHNLCSKSFKLLLVLTKLGSLDGASRSASLCELTKSANTQSAVKLLLICIQAEHPSIAVRLLCQPWSSVASNNRCLDEQQGKMCAKLWTLLPVK